MFFKSFLIQKEIKHFSTTRSGGISYGPFKSLNLGNYSCDKSENIVENRNILAEKLNTTVEKLIIPYQTHGNNVLPITHKLTKMTKYDENKILHGYDATITQERRIFLCVTTADCTPILIFDKVNKAIAAIHAGWRGVINLIIDNTISKMNKYFGTNPKDLIAAIGPSISIDKYEVGNEVIDELIQAGYQLNTSNYHINRRTGKFHIDIKQLNKQRLIKLGVINNKIEVTNYCTYYHKDLFFSARRQGVNSGRMLTGIMLE